LTQNQTFTVTIPDFVKLYRKYVDRYVVIVIINKHKNDFYLYGRRQDNGCEIQFRSLLYTREVLISRTVAHKIYFVIIIIFVIASIIKQILICRARNNTLGAMAN
jgi:hypothetical protein